MSEQLPNWRMLLDHGMLRLVDHMGDDMSVVRSARVSYNAKARNDGGDEKLIRYMLANGHTSPFEHVVFTFEVKAPIFVFRQWHRHRTWSYNEVSARYTELPEEYYVPEEEHITTQSTANKQMRTDVPLPTAEWVRRAIDFQNAESFDVYRKLLASGCPRELARSVLPLGTYSKMFATVDLHNLFHFLRLRLHEHAQMEIRVYAEAIRDIIRPIVPVSMLAFDRSLVGREKELQEELATWKRRVGELETLCADRL